MTAHDWIAACDAGAIDREDVIRVQVEGRALAVYRSPEDTYHATDPLCTHEHAELADGLVMGDVVECPKHNGRFNYKTGDALRVPARVGLRTYPVKVEDGTVFIKLGD